MLWPCGRSREDCGRRPVDPYVVVHALTILQPSVDAVTWENSAKGAVGGASYRAADPLDVDAVPTNREAGASTKGGPKSGRKDAKKATAVLVKSKASTTTEEGKSPRPPYKRGRHTIDEPQDNQEETDVDQPPPQRKADKSNSDEPRRKPRKMKAHVLPWVQCDSCNKWRIVSERVRDKARDQKKPWSCGLMATQLGVTCDTPGDEVRFGDDGERMPAGYRSDDEDWE